MLWRGSAVLLKNCHALLGATSLQLEKGSGLVVIRSFVLGCCRLDFLQRPHPTQPQRARVALQGGDGRVPVLAIFDPGQRSSVDAAALGYIRETQTSRFAGLLECCDCLEER